MNIVIFELATSDSKLAAPMACVNPDSLERLQAAPCVYTLGLPSAFMKRLL